MNMNWTSSGDQVVSPPASEKKHFPWLGLGGAILIVISFFFMSWVSFSVVRYYDFGSDLLNEIAPSLLSQLSEQLAHKNISMLVKWLLESGFSGRSLWILIPNTAILMRLVIVFVGIVGVISFIWNLLCFALKTGTARRRMGKLQAIFAFLAALFLLLQMPTIDAWGSKNTFWPGLLALLMGAQMGYGVWVAWLGLLLVAGSGMIEGFRKDPIAIDMNKVSKFALLGGIGLTLSSALLPWITFQNADYFDTQFKSLTQNIVVDSLIEHMPEYQQMAPALKTGDVEEFIRLLPDQDIQQLASYARTEDYLTGFGIWRQVPQTGYLLTVALLALFLLPLLAIIEHIISRTGAQSATKKLAILYGGGAFFTLLLILSHLPSIDHVGVEREIGIPLIVFLSGADTGAGVWCALLGLSLLSLGAVVKVSDLA